MSNNYHTPIDPIAALDASVVNAPLGQLDAQLTTSVSNLNTLTTNFNNLRNGALDMVQLNFGAVGALTIASDAITVSRTSHLIDTQGLASSDNLVTINGGADGDFLRLRITHPNRIVTVKHLAPGGNIRLAAEADFTMRDFSQFLDLYYIADVGVWVQSYSVIAFHEQGQLVLGTKRSGDGFVVPEGTVILGQGGSAQRPLLAYTPRPPERKSFWINFHNNAENAVGIAAPTVNGTGSTNNLADSTYNRYQSGAVAGNNGGVVSAAFTYFVQNHKPYFAANIRTHTSVAACRIWVGMVSAGIGNYDDLGANGILAALFRFSTVAGDTEWMAVTSDGTTQDTNPSGVAVGVSTPYKLVIRWSPSDSAFHFSINDVEVAATTNNLPGAFGAMGGYICRIETRDSNAKSLAISRIYMDLT